MAYTSVFDLHPERPYWIEDGLWHIQFVARTPPPGSASDITIQIPQQELPANINQTNLANLLKQYLGWQLNRTFAPLNTFMNNGTTVTLP